MGVTVDWAKLVQNNRAKAHGIPWTDEEREALNSGIKPDDVRAGILTKEEAEKADKSDEVKYERMKKDELIKIAKELKIEFLEESVTKNDLILEIRKAEEKSSPDKDSEENA